jgi:hypothetical protein
MRKENTSKGIMMEEARRMEREGWNEMRGNNERSS